MDTGQPIGGLAEEEADPDCHGDLSLQRDVISELPGSHHMEVGACFLLCYTELCRRPSIGCQPVTASSCRSPEAFCNATGYFLVNHMVNAFASIVCPTCAASDHAIYRPLEANEAHKS